MRKNTTEVYQRWRDGRPGGKAGGAIWTDGVTVFSYQTAIATRLRGQYVVNTTRYSVTTTVHQHALWTLLAEDAIAPIEVKGFARGASRTDLTAAAIVPEVSHA